MNMNKRLTATLAVLMGAGLTACDRELPFVEGYGPDGRPAAHCVAGAAYCQGSDFVECSNESGTLAVVRETCGNGQLFLREGRSGDVCTFCGLLPSCAPPPHCAGYVRGLPTGDVTFSDACGGPSAEGLHCDFDHGRFWVPGVGFLEVTPTWTSLQSLSPQLGKIVAAPHAVFSLHAVTVEGPFGEGFIEARFERKPQLRMSE